MIDLNAIVAQVASRKTDSERPYWKGPQAQVERQRALERKPWYDRNLAVLESLRAGDRVRVQVVSSSWAPYDDDPGKAPRTERVYVLEDDPMWIGDYPDWWGKPGRQLVVNVRPAPGTSRCVKPGVIAMRTYNFTTMMQNETRLDRQSRTTIGGTSGAWVHLAPVSASVVDLGAIVASVMAPFDLGAIVAQVQAAADPEPTYRSRSNPQAQVYRLRLTPAEHRALLCLVVASIEGAQQPLAVAVCECLGGMQMQTIQQRQVAMQAARDRGLLDMRRVAGTSDMDVMLDARLLDVVRKAVEQAIESPLCVNPRYRPLEQHLYALAVALSPRGLAQRQYHGES